MLISWIRWGLMSTLECRRNHSNRLSRSRDIQVQSWKKKCTDPPPRTPGPRRMRQIYLIGFSWITRERLGRYCSDLFQFVEPNFAHLLIYNLYIFVEAFGSYSLTKKITKIDATAIILIVHRPHPNRRCVTCSSIICSNFSPIDPLLAELFKVRALGHFEKKVKLWDLVSLERLHGFRSYLLRLVELINIYNVAEHHFSWKPFLHLQK